MKKFLFDLFPVIVFFISSKFGDSNAQITKSFLDGLGLPPTPLHEPGAYLATFTTIVAMFLQVSWIKLRGGKVDKMLWASFGIITILGIATFMLHDRTIIQWKPTVLYWFISITLIGAALFGKNLIKSIMSVQLELPETIWSRLNLSWAVFFAILGVVNLVVARNFSYNTWLDFKVFGIMILMLIFSVLQMVMLNKYLDKEENQ
jgi:intracellular septation protein